MTTEPYGEEFFRQQAAGSLASAREVVPLVIELVHPDRVVDVGCGVGTWLRAFIENGIHDVWGIDGSYVDAASLQIPEGRFIAADLTRDLAVDITADLALSLEVAEHIAAEHADLYLRNLTRLAPCVMFSAAIPHQHGTGHVNGQWPGYWIEKFSRKGYVVVDALREVIWSNDAVEYWYAQNLLLFARPEVLASHPSLAASAQSTRARQLDLVHPSCYQALADERTGYRALYELACAVRPHATLILIDDDAWRHTRSFPAHRVLPFLERGGEYWGSPEHDESAIRELERMRSDGADYVVFAWPAFWWHEHYPGFCRHLRESYPCVLENERVLVFDLRP